MSQIAKKSRIQEKKFHIYLVAGCIATRGPPLHLLYHYLYCGGCKWREVATWCTTTTATCLLCLPRDRPLPTIFLPFLFPLPLISFFLPFLIFPIVPTFSPSRVNSDYLPLTSSNFSIPQVKLFPSEGFHINIL